MLLLFAITAITLALVFYSIGVWSEKLSGQLKTVHVVFFWLGFAFDTTGTTLMGKIAGDAFALSFHSITGALAILLMLVHAVWATSVLARKDETQTRNFHRFSIAVWAIWLIPYLSGAVFGMLR